MQNSYKITYQNILRIWRFAGPYFPAFGLDTEIYRINLRIQSKCGEKKGPEKFRIRTLFTQHQLGRKLQVTGIALQQHKTEQRNRENKILLCENGVMFYS